MRSFACARAGRLLPAVIGLLMLCGCGIKGPLYIPKPPQPPAKQAPAEPAPTDHNKADSKDSAR